MLSHDELTKTSATKCSPATYVASFLANVYQDKKKTQYCSLGWKFQWAMINFCKLVQNIITSVLTTECFILFQSPVHFDKHAKHISADASQGFDQLFVARECDHLIICVCLRRNKCSHFDKTLVTLTRNTREMNCLLYVFRNVQAYICFFRSNYLFPQFDC